MKGNKLSPKELYKAIKADEAMARRTDVRGSNLAAAMRVRKDSEQGRYANPEFGGDLGQFLKNPTANPAQIMAEILDCAQTARKESILALEKKREALSYEPLKMAIGLAVDGTAPEVIRDTLETAAHVVFEEAEVGVKFWEDFGAICPTIGILGAVLGLQHVMSVLDRPEMIGPGIAVAFVATLYGVGAANILGIPIGKKLKRKAIIDGHARAMVVIGVEGILTGMNPKVIEQKLAVFVHDHGGGEKH
jgi:chemotaxis protein MotA